MSEIPCDSCGSEGDHSSWIICDACLESMKGKSACCLNNQAENKQLKDENKKLKEQIEYNDWKAEVLAEDKMLGYDINRTNKQLKQLFQMYLEENKR